jgi:hypothetical protein
MFQRFTAIVNNMKANVEDFPYTEHDQALKLLHILDPNVWGAKVEAIKESGQYLTIELDDLNSKLKLAEVDKNFYRLLFTPPLSSRHLILQFSEISPTTCCINLPDTNLYLYLRNLANTEANKRGHVTGFFPGVGS